jgi:hypothetical protein
MKFFVFSAVIAILLTGCGQKPLHVERHAVYPVEGTVIWKKKPLAKAHLEFVPLGWKLLPFTHAPATFTDKDGHYKLDTYASGDGAPAGKYTVTIWADDGKPGMGRPNILPPQYASAKTSGLEVEIVEGANALPPLDLGGQPDPETKDVKETKGANATKDVKATSKK